MDVYELRSRLFEYNLKHFKKLTELHIKWNEKLKRGITISDEFLFELFGHEILASFDEEEVMIHNDMKVLIGIFVNEDNPFQVVFGYKVEPVHSNVEEYQLFLSGQENMLFDYLEQKGVA